MNEDIPTTNFTNKDYSSIVRFVEILASVNQRVSSKKAASDFNYKSDGLIDKLILSFDTDFDLSVMIKLGKELGYKINGKYLRDKRFYIFFENHCGQSVQAHLIHRDKESFNTITVNPSKFKSLSKLNLFLYSLFQSHLCNSLIKRIDFSINIYDEFCNVIQGLDFALKSAKTEYSDKKSFTGIIIGKGNDKIIAYNKQIESKTCFPWTRVERQLSGNKTPINKYFELEGYLQQLTTQNCLSVVQLNHIEFSRPTVRLTHVQEEQFSDLKSLVSHSGLYQARKKLNINRTFKRDYSKYFLLIPHKHQPNEILKDSMKIYVKGGKDE